MSNGNNLELEIEPSRLIRNRYRLVRLLGKGAFAATYLAEDMDKNRQVAIKAFHPEKVDNWKSFDLFEREVKVLQSITHVGIPSIYDFFEEEVPEKRSCIVMEYIEGELLADRIKNGPTFDRIKLFEFFLKLLDICEYLHTSLPPVLHRDIKPSNIIIRRDGSPVLIDFGSVRTIFKAPDERGSTIIGTYGYMPYEQYMGQASVTSDLYSLAATILEMVTGRPPGDFIGGDGIIIIPEKLECPPILKGMLHRMLAPSVKDRIQSAREVKQHLFSPLISNEHDNTTTSLMRPMANPTALKLKQPPREITEDLVQYYKHYTPKWKQLISISQQGEIPETLTGSHKSIIAGLSIISLGLAPLGVWLYQRHLEKKYRPFFEHGLLTQGKIEKIIFIHDQSSLPKYRVLYSFIVDGKIFKNGILLRPSIAQFWNENTNVHVLYLPDQNYDSIIIGEI